MDNNPPHSLVVVVVGVVEVKYDLRSGAQRPLLSFAGQQLGQSCWTCGGVRIWRDCPQESGGWTLADGFQLAQIQCDNCGRVGHPRECCFDLYPKLRSNCGGVAQRGRGGRDGGGGRGGGVGKGTPTVGAPPMATPPPTTEATMATKIEKLE